MHLLPRVALLLSILAPPALAQQSVPMLPDSAGWGVQVLTDVTAPDGARWVGTYAEGIFVLQRGARAWDRIRTDTTDTSISMDFVNAIAFGPRGEVWYGTVGNGWGRLDGRWQELAQLDHQAARTRVAVCDAGGDQHQGGHDGDRHRRRHPGDD